MLSTGMISHIKNKSKRLKGALFPTSYTYILYECVLLHTMVPGNKSPVKTSGKSSPNKHHLTVKLGPPFKQKVAPITNIEANILKVTTVVTSDHIHTGRKQSKLTLRIEILRGPAVSSVSSQTGKKNPG